MYGSKLYNNPLRNYNDLKTALIDLIEPYSHFMSKGSARIDLGPPGATFNENATCLEGFARTLWGIVPYVAGGNEYDGFDKVLCGITNGTDPDHPEFWGVPGDYDQSLVEMAVFGYALCIIPEKIWEPLEKKAKDNFANWLSYINNRTIPKNNWIFFRILVNCGLQKVGSSLFNESQLNESFDLIDKMYIDEGWYNDGLLDERRARDYYVSWGLHYYGLIFAHCLKNTYSSRAATYIERASLFANEYVYWFDQNGASLPYGRSLTYRFAQCAFWGALALANVAAIPWGQIKSLYLKNLRWWFKQPVFSETGLLSVGYTYPNLNMAEEYNSPNSPLWALKAFISLAVPENYPFWQSGETDVIKEKEVYLQKSSGMIISDIKQSGHLYAINSGQWTPANGNEHLHMAEKYSKFAYSNYFGFNVVTDTCGLNKMGHDNMLHVSENDDYYRYRRETYDYIITEKFLSSKWKPFEWMEIESFIIPSGNWHLRVHRIKSDRDFTSAEGGFALPYNDSFYPISEELHQTTKNQSLQKSKLGFSGILNVFNDRQGKAVIAYPNSNIIHPRSLIPTLLGKHSKGVVWLGCAVLAHPLAEWGERLWSYGVNVNEALANLPNWAKNETEKQTIEKENLWPKRRVQILKNQSTTKHITASTTQKI